MLRIRNESSHLNGQHSAVETEEKGPYLIIHEEIRKMKVWLKKLKSKYRVSKKMSVYKKVMQHVNGHFFGTPGMLA